METFSISTTVNNMFIYTSNISPSPETMMIPYQSSKLSVLAKSDACPCLSVMKNNNHYHSLINIQTFISYCGMYHLEFWVIHLYVIYSGVSP